MIIRSVSWSRSQNPPPPVPPHLCDIVVFGSGFRERSPFACSFDVCASLVVRPGKFKTSRWWRLDEARHGSIINRALRVQVLCHNGMSPCFCHGRREQTWMLEADLMFRGRRVAISQKYYWAVSDVHLTYIERRDLFQGCLIWSGRWDFARAVGNLYQSCLFLSISSSFPPNTSVEGLPCLTSSLKGSRRVTLSSIAAKG